MSMLLLYLLASLSIYSLRTFHNNGIPSSRLEWIDAIITSLVWPIIPIITIIHFFTDWDGF